jgi:hypothetical protein
MELAPDGDLLLGSSAAICGTGGALCLTGAVQQSDDGSGVSYGANLKNSYEYAPGNAFYEDYYGTSTVLPTVYERGFTSTHTGEVDYFVQTPTLRTFATPTAAGAGSTDYSTTSSAQVAHCLADGTGCPAIPTVGTWGALNYPTWVSGTPFVKMTAAGTFALDTNTYLTSSAIDSTSNLLAGNGSGNAVSSGIAASNVPLLNAANTFTATNTFNNATYSALFTGGPVGIGTTTPTALLTTYQTGIYDSGTQRFIDFTGDPFGTNPATTSNAGALTAIRLGNTNNGKYAMVGAVSEDPLGYSRTTGLSFWTATQDAAPLERMRISGNGNVSIGDTTATSMFNVGTANQFQVTSTGVSSAGAGSTDYSIASSAQVAHCLADGTGCPSGVAVPLYTPSGTSLSSSHQVIGSGTMTAGTLSVTFTGAAVFTSSGSYVCTANDGNAASAIHVYPINGYTVSFIGTAGDTVLYSCTGN